MEKICKQCGKIFKKNKQYSKKQWDKAKFCSPKCLNDSKKGIKKSKKWNWKKICKTCGKEFSINKKASKKQWKLSQYCSRNCAGANENLKEKRRIACFKNGNKPPVQKGEKNCNWKGGISFEPYSIDWTETLKRSIRERDNYICQICSQYGNYVHHINYDKKNCNPNNLITLCCSCHNRTNNRNRNYWINYFNGLL